MTSELVATNELIGIIASKSELKGTIEDNEFNIVVQIMETGQTGLKGDKGEDGYTPIKNVDYFDGIQGVKGDKGDKGDIGLTGSQGIQGIQGNDGYTPTKGVDYFDGLQGEQGIIGLTGLQGEKGVQGDTGIQGIKGNDGYSPVKGTDYFDGKDGKDGYTPIKGIDYFDGEKGLQGNDGYTPVKGVDYFDGEKGDKGDTGSTGVNGIDGTVSFDELTISQKSELTEGLKNDITQELQADTVSLVKVPPSNVFANVSASMLSYETFTPDTLKVVSIIEKNALYSGNYYSTNNRPFVGLYKDDNNYIRLYVSGYNVILENKVSGISTNINYNNAINSISPLTDVHITLDLIRKKIELKGLNATRTLVTIIDEDISSFDLSALDSFKIMSGAGKQAGNQFNIYVRINEYFDYETLLLEHMRVNDYNVLPIINKGTGIYPTTSINLGGTITNTISNTHKIANVNMASFQYFAMQGNNTSISSLLGTTIVTRFKVTSMTEGTYFGTGASSVATVVDEDNNIIYRNTGTFVPELNKWYYLSNTTDTRAIGYHASYGMMAFGTFTIEVEGLYIGYPKSQNMCAETWNGSYFTGSLPFKGTNVIFTTMSPLTSQTGKYIPIGCMTLDASKNIMMYNGANWLKIN